MTFGTALDSLEYMHSQTAYMRLSTWDTRDRIKIQWPDENSKMTAPYLYNEVCGNRVPWFVNNLELFSTEWEVVK